jgi:multidrug efflux pump subunit AcrA (membrane-fusion protein)/YHS domain-containing protein
MISDMKKLVWVVLLLVVLAGSFLAGSWYSKRDVVRSSASDRRSSSAVEESESDTPSMPPGTVRVSPEKQQLIGIKLSTVEKKAVTNTFRLLGRVASDETRIYRIIAAADGWIVKTFNNPTGSLVKKDDVLASVFIPELLLEQRNYITWIVGGGLGASDRILQTRNPLQYVWAKQQFIENLQKLGMGDAQIEEVERTRQVIQTVLVKSPATGFVTLRDVSPAQRFQKGNELFRVVDLSRIWILADIFENESQYLQPGKSIKVSLPHQQKSFQAKMSDVLPLFDPVTRTLKVRFEADNPGFVLKPDMFVDLELPINLQPAMTVPTDAVLDSGIKRIVFVEHGNGFFEPREVETGKRIGNRVEIVKGLTPGEKIVVSGNFLIDSESRLELAASGMTASLAKDPVCGMDVSVSKAEKAGRRTVYKNVSYYFCSDECKVQFDKNPDRFIKKP